MICRDVLSSVMGDNTLFRASKSTYEISTAINTGENEEETAASETRGMTEKIFAGCTINGLVQINFKR